MNSSSQSLLSSICKSVKKQCIIKAKIIPHDRVLFYMLKLFTLASPLPEEDEAETKKYSEFIIKEVSNFLMSNYISMATIEIQIYFNDHHISKESVLQKRRQVIKQTTDSFLQHILQKKITKNKQDSDQIYHLISCYIILFSGAGDPTDDEVLKETTVALKSILSTKEIVRFTTKATSVKKIQLGDVCSIVIGIKILNKDSAQKTANENELFSHLQKALVKCSSFLEYKTREIRERSQYFIRICLLSLSSSSKDDCIQEINQLKSYIILLQQIFLYFQILKKECHMLNEEFQECCVVLEQRLTRVRKTVKYRTAIPVVEIYPQFKDISLLWNKIQDLSVVLNHLTEIVYDIYEIFDKVSEPSLENLSFETECDFLNEKSENISFENQDCELITAETSDDFYNIFVEFNGFCIVTFVDSEGIITPGIKEYGIVRYRNKQYCFCTTICANKFCLNPEKYIGKMRPLTFIWPETISLLTLEKYLQSTQPEKKCETKQFSPTTISVEVQTEIHPIPSFKDYNYTSSVWQLQQKIVHLAELKKYRTHSVQTIESNFRRNAYTQTGKKIKPFK